MKLIINAFRSSNFGKRVGLSLEGISVVEGISSCEIDWFNCHSSTASIVYGRELRLTRTIEGFKPGKIPTNTIKSDKKKP